MKLWPDDNHQPWRLSVKDIDGEILLVSQFTLLASVKKPRPSFHRAMNPSSSKELYASVVEGFRQAHNRPEAVKDGLFGAMMQVHIVNDGPVTIVLDSPSTADSTDDEKRQ